MSDALDRQLTLARHYGAIDQHERVIETLRRAEEGALASVEYWELRARALHELDRQQEAATAAGKGLELEPESIELLLLRSEALARLDRWPEAERAILAALRLDPEDPALLCSYARLSARAGQIDKASRLVAEAERVDPENPRVIAARLLLAHLQGKDAEAASHGRELLSQAPDQAGSHYLAAFSLEQAGRGREAERHFRTAVHLEPVDKDYADAARESRFARHPLLLPIRLVSRLSPGGLWLAVMATLGVLHLMHARSLVNGVLGAYLLLCLYSWVVPPALRFWLRRRRA